MQNFDLVLPLARDALAHSSFAPDLLRRIAQIKNVLDRAARDGDGAAAVEAQDQAAALGEILERYPPVGRLRLGV